MLPPDIEARLAACEAIADAMRDDRANLKQELAILLAEDVHNDDEDTPPEIPEETFDDPSVVRAVDALSRVERRVTRTSTPPMSMSMQRRR